MPKHLTGNEAELWKNWNTASAALKWPNNGEATTWMYISPDGRRFDLEGRYRGRQGVRLAPDLHGAHHLPFEHLFTESAYQVGSTYERSNINKRTIKAGVILGGKGVSSHQYRMIEDNWWAAWPHDRFGWLGGHTRFGGWRWAQVLLGDAVEDAVKFDPTTHGNNVQLWNITVVAPKPWYSKRMLYETWHAHPDTVATHGADMETIAIANRGQFFQWPLFLVKPPGRAWVQDGMTDRMVQLPTLQADDGYVLVDTDPSARTLTASKDPVDNIFFELARGSKILDFFLHDISALGLPVWRRANGIRFMSQIPPRTVANITVKHDNPEGAVTVFMPQRYMRTVMTHALSEVFALAEQTIGYPLEFTRNIGGALQSQIIAAFSPPVMEQDPVVTMRYVNARRQLLCDGAKAQPLIRMQDKNLNMLATVGQEKSCHFEEIAHDSGNAAVVIRGGDYLGDFVRNAVRVEEDLHLSIDPIGTQPDWPTRWGGKIVEINVQRDSDGVHTVELVALANREHYKSLLIGATPWMPPEVQPIKMWMLPANIRTACFITLFINLARLFFPPLSVLTNIANPAGWINPLGLDAILNFDPLSWPIQPQFVNPVFDQSRTSLLTSTWGNFHDATKDPLKDAGCTGRIWTYFQGDPTHPHPELEKLIRAPGALLDMTGIGGPLEDLVDMTADQIANITRPHRNCLIAGFDDNSGIEGPTGTAIDGPINLFAKTLDDLITSTVLPVDVNDDGEVDPVFRRIFGVAPTTPWAIYRDGNQSGIIESGYQQHKGPTKTIMTGGKSPKLVNDLQTFAIRWGISQIAQAITSMPGMPAELQGVEGLDNVYQGQF